MKHRSFHGSILLVCIGLASVPCAFASDEYAGVAGHYVLENPSNEWHHVAINTAPDLGPFTWVNRAGKRWEVGTGQKGKPGGGTAYHLTFGQDTPYPGHTLDIIRDADGNVTGLTEWFANGQTQRWNRQTDTKEPGDYAGVAGDYVLENPSNDWHYVAVNTAPDLGPFVWVNRAGRRWKVGTGQKGKPGGGVAYHLTFDQDTPYPGHTLDIIRDADGNVTGLTERFANGQTQRWKRL